MLAQNHALVVALQQALRQRGYDPGPIDGVNGLVTRRAVSAFQRDHHLPIDGIAGPMTLRHLGLNGGGAGLPGWLAEARAHQGLSEVRGAGSNPVLIAWAKRLGLAYQDDRQPWCGLFVAHCLAHALPVEALPKHPLAARSWLQFGQPCAVQMGAVLIFWRGTPSSWTGHVGFCVGGDRAAYHVLGGNQGDVVSTARISRKRLLGARWPTAVAMPGHPEPLLGDAGQALSQNEA